LRRLAETSTLRRANSAFGEHIKTQHADYYRVTKEAGIKVD
jgi:hypothetical protein